MKIRLLAFLCLLLGSEVFAESAPKTQGSQSYGETQATSTDSKDEKKSSTKNSKFFKQITPELMYSYIDFSFNSTSVPNFNRYRGHSNLYSAGADRIEINEKLYAGIYYFNIDTKVHSKFFFSPIAGLTRSGQQINNNTIFAHVLKLVGTKGQFYLDLAGAFGQNKLKTNFTSSKNQVAIAANNNTNWLATLNGIYRKNFDKISFRANLGVLATQTNSPNYSFLIQGLNIRQPISALVNKVILIMENAELAYGINPTFSPFFNLGLIQVGAFHNSRALIIDQINGILPQLNLDKDAVRVGGGVTINHKNMTLRLEEKYYNAGRTFESTQAIASFEYRFD